MIVSITVIIIAISLLWLLLLRSNFNTREFNIREHFQFGGHNSVPRRRIWTKLGGNESQESPRPF